MWACYPIIIHFRLVQGTGKEQTAAKHNHPEQEALEMAQRSSR